MAQYLEFNLLYFYQKVEDSKNICAVAGLYVQTI